MSEEEIKEKMWNLLIDFRNDVINEAEQRKVLSVDKYLEDFIDLYQQEKEKNKELIERNKALSNNMLSLACNSIRKDKIREYRKQFIKDNKKEKTFMTQSSQINASLIKFCEALLLEEE